MQNYIKRGKLSVFTLLLAISGLFLVSCDDDKTITIGSVDESPYIEATGVQGFLRSSTTSLSTIAMEMKEDVEAKVYFGLTKGIGEAVNAQIAIDESLVEAYNKVNFTSYEAFPASNVSFGNSGKLSVEKWKTESIPLSIFLSKNNLEPATYILPIVVRSADTNLLSGSQVLYYFITVTDNAIISKNGTVKTLCYVEVNNNNILNVGSYTLKDSGAQFFDIAVIFAANIRYNSETGEVYLKYNENVSHILANRDKYIKPLQDKGIKVILGLLGDHDFVGLGNLQGESLKSFAMTCKIAVDTYGLDGVDFDDEWTDYPTTSVNPQWYPTWSGSGTKLGRLIIETRRLMPDKIITVFEYNNGSSIPTTVDGTKMTDIIDYSMYAMYGNSTSLRSSNIGMPKEKFSPTAVSVTSGNGSTYMSSTNLRTVSTNIKNQGYGLIFFYDLRAANIAAHLTYSGTALYGEDVVMSGPSYSKDW